MVDGAPAPRARLGWTRAGALVEIEPVPCHTPQLAQLAQLAWQGVNARDQTDEPHVMELDLASCLHQLSSMSFIPFALFRRQNKTRPRPTT